MLSDDEIVEQEQKVSSEAVLGQDHIIEMASGEWVTVEEILREPKKYHGQSCSDPHEPDYGNSTIAIIYSNQKEPIIYSHAHGGISYRFAEAKIKKDEPDYSSPEYVLEHFYMVNYDKKDEIYHINGNIIDKYSYSSFNHTFRGWKVEVTDGTNQHLMEMTKFWLDNIHKKYIRDDGFAPDKPIIYEKNGKLVINEYVPDILHYGLDDPSQEECEHYAFPQVSHIKTMIHDEREAEILIDQFAYLIQHPNERPMFAPLIISETRGVGKDMMTDIFSNLMGNTYAKKSSIGDLSNESGQGNLFNQTKLITVSECGSSSDRFTIGNTIKDAITTVNKMMNMKHGKVIFGRVYAGIIFFSNTTSPFRLDEGDRRFFVTRCDWSKEIADKYKNEGYFTKLYAFYEDPIHQHGLQHWLLNRTIRVDMKGDAPMTSTKMLMMESEPNEVERFFKDLSNHPCRYWTKAMIDAIFEKVLGSDLRIGNKQYGHHMSKLIELYKDPIKVMGKPHRIKTFTLKDADVDRIVVRQNAEEHQGKTTMTLYSSAGEPIEYSDKNDGQFDNFF